MLNVKTGPFIAEFRRVSGFLSYPLVWLTPSIHISLLNILIWVGLFFAARYTKRALKKYVRSKNIHQQQITLAGKEIPFLSLVKQLTNILFVIIALQSLSLTNNGSGLKQLLDIKILEFGKFNVSVYNVSLFILLLVIAKLLSTLVKLSLQKVVSGKSWIDKGKEYTITTLAQYFIYTIFIVIGIRSFGVDLTLLVASSAALFVGLGLGIQKIFGDIVSGFILLFEGTVKVGDIVDVDGEKARIVQINIRTSKARTYDGNVIIVPNSKLTTENINHWSFNNKSVRFDVNFYLKPDISPEVVRQILYDCALQHPQTDKRKNVMVLFDGFIEGKNHFKLYFWTEKIWEIDIIKSDLRFAAEQSFRSNGLIGGEMGKTVSNL